MARGSSYAGVPPGPLSAYLGVREGNREADDRMMGFLAKLQEAQEARRMNEEFRRDQLAQRAELFREGTESRNFATQQVQAAASGRAQADRESREHLLRLAAQLRPPRPEAPPAPVTPVRIVRDGREVMVDARTGSMIGEAVPRTTPQSSQVNPEIAARIVEDEGTKLLSLIGTNPTAAASLLSPLNRGVEAARGVFDTKYQGPALESQASKQRLLFAVDQLVKSGKSSNEFLRRLESALGMGTMTTPENARQAIQEAINMTRGMAGLPPPAAPPAPKPKSPSQMSDEELLKALSGG